jgi:hypothetical protein
LACNRFVLLLVLVLVLVLLIVLLLMLLIMLVIAMPTTARPRHGEQAQVAPYHRNRQ